MKSIKKIHSPTQEKPAVSILFLFDTRSSVEERCLSFWMEAVLHNLRFKERFTNPFDALRPIPITIFSMPRGTSLMDREKGVT